MKTDNAIQFSKNWYNYGHDYVPDFPSQRFNRFAARATELAFQLLAEKNKPATGLKMRVENSPAAYCVPSAKQIVLPAFYFVDDFLTERFGSEVKLGNFGHLAMCAINGSTIHETLHLVYTPEDTIDAMITRGLYSDSEFLKSLGGLAPVFVNVFEDIFIEAHSPKRFAGFLDAKNMILFGDKDLNEKDPETMASLLGVAEIIAAYKRIDLRSHKIWKAMPGNALNILRKVETLPETASLQTRIRLVADFCREFPELTSEEKEKAGKGADGGESAGEPKPGLGLGSEDGDSEVEKILKSLVEKLGSEGFKKVLAAIRSEVDSEVEKISRSIVGSHVETTRRGTVSWLNPEIVPISKYPFLESMGKETVDGTDFSFIRELIALRTFNHTIGIARKAGSKMVNTRLARIATDGKIFAHQDSEKENEKRIEIVILVDASGSTSLYASGGTIYGNELGAAKEIAKALRQARIPFCVVTHTTSPTETNIPWLAVVESYDMKVRNEKGNENWKIAERIDLSENMDGVAIRTVVEKCFTSRQARRFVIVLSDGEPAAPTYSGSAGIQHTREEISNQRKNGINIFSISVVSGVEDANDNIYGSEYNLKASSNLRGQFRNLIRKIGGGQL